MFFFPPPPKKKKKNTNKNDRTGMKHMKSDVHLGEQFGSLGRKQFQDGYDESAKTFGFRSLRCWDLLCLLFLPMDHGSGKWGPGRCVFSLQG